MEPARPFDPPDSGDSTDPAASWSAVTYSGHSGDQHAGAPADQPPAGPPPPEHGRPGPKPRRPPGKLSYAPGLDGVRALAVTAVVIYHLGATWLPGGFLGVDVFFVLSGFLITSILLTEFGNRSKIDIGNFYLRRARRLLPALYAMLVVTVVVAAVFVRDALHELRGDVIAALTYCTNWTQIVWNRSYFGDSGRPSILQHLWSLAVEEQFYLVWPLVLVLCLATRRRWVLFAVTVALTIASTVRMGVLFSPGSDPRRVYYGTDTHIAPMLVGAAVAIVLVLRRQANRSDVMATRGPWLDGAALVGVLGLAWAVVKITYTSTGLYQGGYLLIALATAALVLAASSPVTYTARVLGWTPFVWVGKRSYAIYLWHWPILMLTGPWVHISLHGPVRIVVQVGATVLLSDLSFRYLERPIRAQGFLAFLRGTAERTRSVAPGRTRTETRARTQGTQRRSARIGAVAAAAVVAVVVCLATAPGAPAGIEVDQHHPKPTISFSAPPETTPTHSPSGSGSSSASSQPPPPPFARPVRVSWFGDSQGMTLLINKPDGISKYLTTSDSTVEGCSVIGGTITSKVGYSRDMSADCGDWPTLWKQNADKNKPQIAVVELGAWDVFDLTLNGKKLDFGSSPWDTYWEQQLEKGIHILLDAGAQVALMGVPCYRPIAAGGLPLLPERGYDTRTRHVTSLLQKAAAKDPSEVFMVDPPGQFCHGPIASDVNYRWDGTHYYIPGAALVFRTLTPQLLAIPQRRKH